MKFGRQNKIQALGREKVQVRKNLTPGFLVSGQLVKLQDLFMIVYVAENL